VLGWNHPGNGKTYSIPDQNKKCEESFRSEAGIGGEK
jgi:hypothetical protein